jgi:hypothetical protein
MQRCLPHAPYSHLMWFLQPTVPEAWQGLRPAQDMPGFQGYWNLLPQVAMSMCQGPMPRPQFGGESSCQVLFAVLHGVGGTSLERESGYLGGGYPRPRVA